VTRSDVTVVRSDLAAARGQPQIWSLSAYRSTPGLLVPSRGVSGTGPANVVAGSAVSVLPPGGPGGPQGVGKVVNQGPDLPGCCWRDDAVGRPMCLCRSQRDRRGALTWRRGLAITSQGGSHKGGSGTRSGRLLTITAGQAERNGLCRPPRVNQGCHRSPGEMPQAQGPA
jgi:hypothetical protein